MFGQVLSAIGGLSGVGSVLGPVLGFMGQEASNDANIMLARENRHHATELSNTQYQRAVTDMKAAGLNPALMFKNAGPASTPVTQAAQTQSEMGAAVSSAAQLSSAFATVQKIGAELGLIDAQEKNIKAQTITELAKEKNVKALTDLYGANTAKSIMETITESNRPSLVQAQTGQAQASAFSQYASGGRDLDAAERTRVETGHLREFGRGQLGDSANSVDALIRRLFDGLGLAPPRR